MWFKNIVYVLQGIAETPCTPPVRRPWQTETLGEFEVSADRWFRGVRFGSVDENKFGREMCSTIL